MFTFPLNPADLFHERFDQMQMWGIPPAIIQKMETTIDDPWREAKGGSAFEWSQQANAAEATGQWLLASDCYAAARFPSACTPYRQAAHAQHVDCYLKAAPSFSCHFERYVLDTVCAAAYASTNPRLCAEASRAVPLGAPLCRGRYPKDRAPSPSGGGCAPCRRQSHCPRYARYWRVLGGAHAGSRCHLSWCSAADGARGRNRQRLNCQSVCRRCRQASRRLFFVKDDARLLAHKRCQLGDGRQGQIGFGLDDLGALPAAGLKPPRQLVKADLI